MKARHKRHMMHGSHHKNGGSCPPHIAKAGGGPVEKNQNGPNSDKEGGMPSVVSGNANVIAAAKKPKNIGEVPGIYAKGRLDRRARGGKVVAKA